MPLRPIPHTSQCFICEDHSLTGDRIHQRLLWDDEALRIVARNWIGPDCQGPPGHAHGGSLFGMLDEAMGMSAWMQEMRVLAAHLEIDYLRPVPLSVHVDVSGWVVAVDGRKVHTMGEIRHDGDVAVTATGLFVIADPSKWPELAR